MAKLVIIRDGVVVNLVQAGEEVTGDVIWQVADDYPVTVGDAIDPNDPVYDAADVVSLKGLYRHENLIRQLIRALRASSSAANTAATSAGLPSAAQSADLTVAQFRTAVKSLL